MSDVLAAVFLISHKGITLIYKIIFLPCLNPNYKYIKKKIDKTQIIRYNGIRIQLSYSIRDTCIVGFLEIFGGNSFKE